MIAVRLPLVIFALLGAITLVILNWGVCRSLEPPADPGKISPTGSYTGSVSCRKCHEKLYQLWAPSHHGLAMQPYTSELAGAKLSPQTEDIVIGDARYRADIGGDTGWVVERGPQGEKQIQDRPRDRRQERILLPYLYGSWSAPDSACGI